MTAPVVPAWMTKVIVTAIIGVLVSGGAAWTSHLSAHVQDDRERIVVMEEHQKGVDKALQEIKDSQREINQKLDRLIERGTPRVTRSVPTPQPMVHKMFGQDDHNLTER